MPDLAELNLLINSQGVVKANSELNKLTEAGKKAEDTQKRLGNESGRSSSIMGGLADSYSKLYSILLKVAAGAGAVGLALKAVQLAGAQEGRLIGFTTLLKDGEAAKKMLGELRVFANETPFEFPELADSAKKMLAFGFASKDVIPMLRDIGDAASSLGGGADLMDQIVRAMGQMSQKGRIAGQEMNQMAEAGVPAWKYIAEMLGTTIPAAMEKVERGEVSVTQGLAAFREGMRKDFAGGMEAQSKTLLGLWSTLKDEVGTALTDIGETIIEVFGLKGKLGEAIKVTKDYGALIGDVLRVLAGLTPKHKELNEASARWAEILKQVGIVLGIVFGAQMIAMMGGMVVKILQLVKAFASMSVTASPVLTIIVAVGAALAGWTIGQALFDQFEDVKKAGLNVITTLAKAKLMLGGDDETAKADRDLLNQNLTEHGLKGDKSGYTITAYEQLKANNLFSKPEAGAPRQYLDPKTYALSRAGTLSDEDQAMLDKRINELKGGQVDIRGFIIDKINEMAQKPLITDAKGGDFMGAMKDSYLKTLTDLKNSATPIIDSLFGDSTKASREASAAMEDLTSTKKKTVATDKVVLNSADIYIQQLKREENQLTQLNVLGRYQEDLRQVEIKLNGELTGSEEEKTAAKAKYLNLVKQEIITLEGMKVQKEVGDSIIAQQRQLAIVSGSYGEERAALLAVEQQLGKAQQDGITFSSEYVANLKAQNLELIRGQKEAAKLDRLAEDIGNSFGDAFEGVITGTKSMGEAVTDVLKDIEKAMLKAFVIQPITDAVSGYARTAMGGLSTGIASLFGGGTTTPATTPPPTTTVSHNAMGGFISSPTFFNYNGTRTGSAGERGTEVIMPTARTADGRLGVVAVGGGGGGTKGTTVHQTINIHTQDADSFRKSRRQIAMEIRKGVL